MSARGPSSARSWLAPAWVALTVAPAIAPAVADLGDAQGLSLSAQAPSPPVRLVSFLADPREPEFGAVYQLTLTVRAAPETVVFFPDTLIPSDVSFSADAATWTTEPGPADSLDIRATFPVMSFGGGGVWLPFLELWTEPAPARERAGARPASALDAEPSARERVEGHLLTLGGVPILPHSGLSSVDGAPAPRPPADVMGGRWSPWALAAAWLSALAAAYLLWTLAGSRRNARRLVGLPIGFLASARADALHELDRIRAEGWHANGRVADFYDATTGVLRRFSASEEPEAPLALTSTELLGRLGDRWGADRAGVLTEAIATAEGAKFGGHRPGAATAEGHWNAVRAWIEEMPES